MNTKISALYLYAVHQPKFLIARFSSIGDIIMTAPVVQALQTHYGDKAQIDFITLTKFKGAAELISSIDNIYTVEKSTAEISSDLQKNGYDYLIDLHSNVRSRSLSRALNITTFKVNKLVAARLSLVLGLRKKPVEHFIERSLNLLAPFSISTPTSNPWGTINCTVPSTTLPSNFIAIVPGATHHGKELPESTLEEICTKVDSNFVIVGGPEILHLGLSLKFKFPQKVKSLCGLTTLSETAFVMKNARLAIGGDTGAMHIATAVNTPLISVWGCTRPSLGLHPWQPHPSSIILEPYNRGHKPCSRHGAKCRYKKFNKDLCINTVTAESIINAINTITQTAL